MEHASNQDKSAFATEPVGRLIVKFAIPCVISLVVNALYNIVDQIFIGWGVGYLGNGATNVVFPITIIALALAVLIGDGGAAYLSLKLGEGDLDSVKKGVGNAAVMITIAGIAMLVINTVFDPIFIFIFDMGVRGAAIATILGQIISFLVSIFYLPRFKTFHFDRSALRLHKRVCLSVLSLGVSSFITQIAITIVMALFNNLLAVYGAASVYGSEIPLTAMGIVMKVNQIMLSILVGIAIGAQPVIGFNYGCKNFHRVKRAFEVAIAAAEIIAIIAFFIFQFTPMSVVSKVCTTNLRSSASASSSCSARSTASRPSPPSTCRQSASPSSRPSSRCPDRSCSSSRSPCCCPRRWVLSVCSGLVRPPMPWPSSSHWL